MERSQHAYMLVYIRHEEEEAGAAGAELSVEDFLSLDLELEDESSEDEDPGQARVIPEYFPATLRAAVQEEQCRFNSEIIERVKERLHERLRVKAQQRKMTRDYLELEHQGSMDTAEFLPLLWIRRWLGDPLNCGPIETTDLLCLHGHLSIEKLHQAGLDLTLYIFISWGRENGNNS